MLKTLGYSVGEAGAPKKFRHQVLRIVMTSELPLVGSPVYTFEWGAPNSSKRFDKLKRTLSGLIQNADTSWEKAIIEWGENLKFIETLNLNL